MQIVTSQEYSALRWQTQNAWFIRTKGQEAFFSKNINASVMQNNWI